MASVAVEQVKKSFGTVEVIHGIDVDIGDGEFVVLVGPSGCGKSTLLRMIAGLEDITEGEISIGETVVNRVPPKDRDIAMVFQNYALYPHMSVYREYGLRPASCGKTPKDDHRPHGSRSAAEASSTSASTPRRVGPSNCRADSASASPWAGPSCANRRSSCSTSRCRTSTPSCRVQMRTEIKKIHQKVQTTVGVRDARSSRSDDAWRIVSS